MGTGEHRPHLTRRLIPPVDRSLWDWRPSDGRRIHFLRDTRILCVFISETSHILNTGSHFQCSLKHWQAEHSPARGLPVQPLQRGSGSRVDTKARYTSGDPGSAPPCDLGQGNSLTFSFLIHKMRIVLVLPHNILGKVSDIM